MPRPIARLLCVSLVLIFAVFYAGPSRAAEQKFSAGFRDGSRITDAKLTDWQRAGTDPKLNNRPLLDANNPLRWMRAAETESAATPGAYVEFFGGDCLPGRVQSYDAGAPGAREHTPHLVVEADIPLDMPSGPKRDFHISPRLIRRIVWQRKSETYSPSTIFYRDGRQMTFRSLRFTPVGVLALQAQERQEISFGEIAELHMPAMDAWEAYFDQTAALATDPKTRLWRIETTDGLIVTASTERMYLPNRGEGNNSKTWIQGVQPAWSLDPLWVRLESFYQGQLFLPHEPPASLIAVQSSVQRSLLSGGWRTQLNRTVHGASLEAGGRGFGWGLGVHAYSEVTWNLPAPVKSFRTSLALDPSAGRGGCIKAWITVNSPTGAKLFETKEVIGSEQVLETGAIALTGPGGGQKQLILVVDPLAENRPSGADPLDIRDAANWLEPMFELDSDKLQAELAKRRLRMSPDWDSWTSDEEDKLVWSNRWEIFENSPAPGTEMRLFLEARPKDPFVTLSRRIKIGSEHRYMQVYLDRTRDGRNSMPSRVQFRIDGRAVDEVETPVRNNIGEARPFLIPIDKFRGRTVLLEAVMLKSTDDLGFVRWGGVALSESIPGLREVFEDTVAVGALTPGPNSTASLDTEAPYSGSHAIKVSGGEGQLVLDPIKVRRRPQPGEFRYIRYVWRKPKGSSKGKALGLELNFVPTANAPADGRPVITDLLYMTGYGIPKEGHPNRKLIKVGDSAPPEGWYVVFRDLTEDFGDGDLVGLKLIAPNTDNAQLDHVYLCRTYEDLSRCPIPNDLRKGMPWADKTLSAVGVKPGEFGQIVSAVAPQFSASTPGWQGIGLVTEHMGRANVLRTEPPDPSRVLSLRAPLNIPAGKKTRVKFSISHKPNSDWHLYVKVGTEQLFSTLVSDKTTKNGWLDMDVDLSKFAGQKIVLDLQNGVSNAGNGDAALWSKVEVVSQ